MIKTFQPKGLKAYFETGTTKGVRADHANRLTQILSALDVAATPGELNLPGYRLHPLKGQLIGYRSMTVSGNRRAIFRFVGVDVELVDYLDYH